MKRTLAIIAVSLCIAFVAAVAWHSVEEIHYLKGFYPESFTVQEAFYASGVELVKVLIIAIPVLAAAFAILWFFRNGSGR